MEDLSSCILMKVFKWLDTRELIRCSNVCTQWRDVVYDSCLWKQVDLTDHRWTLDHNLLTKLIHSRFQPCLRSLNLSGFSLTSKIMNELAEYCPNLKALMLENVTFVGFENLDDQDKFPKTLEYLDLRLSTGDSNVFKLISTNVPRVKYLGFTDGLLMHGNQIPNLFENLKNAIGLDFNCCNSFYDAGLTFIGCFCESLTSLSISNCNNIRGNNLYLITDYCRNLKALKFSGTSLEDDNLAKCKWNEAKIEELEISWCRNVTEDGLIMLLPQLPHLVYLRLCSCGFGQAITDDVLRTLEPSIHKKLSVLDVSYSREITNDGTAGTIDLLPTLDQVNIACCPKLNPDLLRKIFTNKQLLVVASFQDDNSYLRHSDRYNNSTKLMTGELLVGRDWTAYYNDTKFFSFRNEFKKY